MRKREAAVLLIAVWALAAGARPAAGREATLSLKADVVCAGPRLPLAAVVAGELPASLASRELGDSPAPGTERTLERRRLRRQLAAWGWSGELTGPEAVRVRTPGVVLDGASLAAAAVARLDALLAAEGLERLGEPDGLPERIVLSGASLRWEVELAAGQRGARRLATLGVTDRAGFSVRYRLRVACAKPVAVPVAAAAVRAGEAVTAWNIASVDSLALAGAPLTPPELAEAVARRTITAGEPLTRRNVKPSLLVRAGREVEISLRRGAVSVSLKGIARRDGGLGDIVTVRRLDNRGLERYRVVGPDRVAPPYIAPREDES
jgi:flagella basal body P-ring formation protein FlgA